MKKVILASAMLLLSYSVMAQHVVISEHELGSGTPNNSTLDTTKWDNATKWDNEIYHAPQYMPGYPTAATLFPRVIDLECIKTVNGLACKGYNWTPDMGRGEYLMFHPVVVEPEKPIIVTNTIVKEVLVEVPVKKKGE